jgi:hypothetical protein
MGNVRNGTMPKRQIKKTQKNKQEGVVRNVLTGRLEPAPDHLSNRARWIIFIILLTIVLGWIILNIVFYAGWNKSQITW